MTNAIVTSLPLLEISLKYPQHIYLREKGHGVSKKRWWKMTRKKADVEYMLKSRVRYD